MRLALALLLGSCAPTIDDDVILVVPARDIAEQHVEGVQIELAVPREPPREPLSVPNDVDVPEPSAAPRPRAGAEHRRPAAN